MDELLRKLLPDLSPETLDRVARLTGAPELLEPGDWEKANRQLQELEADPLLHEPPGDLADELPRLEGHRAALAPLIKKCLGHPRFTRLVEVGFGTERYSASEYPKEHSLNERAARELEERCSLAFPALRREVEDAMEASLVLQARISEVRERLQQIDELTRKLQQLRGRLERWPKVQLETARWKLRRYLEATPGLLEQVQALF